MTKNTFNLNIDHTTMYKCNLQIKYRKHILALKDCDFLKQLFHLFLGP